MTARLTAKLWRASAADIDELTQEVFVIAHRSWGEIRTLANPLGYVMGIANNLALQHYKSERAIIGRFGKVADVDEEEPAAATADFSTPHQALPHKRGLDPDEAVRRWLVPLARRPKQAEAVELRYAQGLAVAEIAEYLQMPEKVVRNNSERGIKLLKETYSQGPASDGA